MPRSRDYSQKAFGLVDRVSENERDLIAAYYYLNLGELDKATDTCQLAIRNHSRDWSFHNNLGMIYVDVGQYEEGLKEGLEAARLQPAAEPTYRRQLDAYICTDRLSVAKQLAENLRAQGLDRARIHQRFLELAYVEDDQPADRNVHGKRRESQGLYRRAVEAALRQGLRNAASELEEADVRADALVGNCQTARRLGRPALALAICGDAVQAERLAAETQSSFQTEPFGMRCSFRQFARRWRSAATNLQ